MNATFAAVSAAQDEVSSAVLRYRGALALGERDGVLEALIDLCRRTRALEAAAHDALFDATVRKS